MNTQVSIVMYHYVRDIDNSPFPGIKARRITEFESQINYFRKQYNIISIQDLISALGGERKLPKHALLLTFDDGYKDHYQNVFPILKRYNITGCFYPSGKAIDKKIVLDVNKIHFILAAVKNTGMIVHDIFQMLDEHRTGSTLKSNEYYYSSLNKPNNYDTGEVIFIKRLLQRELSVKLRKKMIDSLFRKHVTEDEHGFSEELYMTKENIREMINQDMHFGSHGYDHHWMDTLQIDENEREINLSLKFIGEQGGPCADWTLCYPYGAYDESILNTIRQKGCRAGFITGGRIADISNENPLLLPRLDTNQLPIIH